MTSSWGGVLVKMMVDGRGGVKSPNWGVHASRSHIFKYDTKLQK